MAANETGKGPFHTPHHICIVVRDIAKAITFYESIGIGPWLDYPPLEEFTELLTPDNDTFRKLDFKLAQVGPIQIQLGQPPEGDTYQGRFLAERGEGVFHMGFVVDDVDAAEADAVARGLEVLMRGRRENGSGFTYFKAAEKGGITLSIRKSPPVV